MFHYLVRFYYWANYEMQDPRTAHLPTLMSPLIVLGCLLFYNYFCISLGPSLMKNRKAFEIKKIMIIYNVIQVIMNAILFHQAFTVGWSGYYSYLCNDLDFTDSPFHRKVALLCYFYYLLKVSDLLDTIFFVLRKKGNHLSFLHLYHHTGMVILGFSNAKWLPGGHHTFVGLANSFVHVFMYFYYLMAIIYPSEAVYRWKRFITQLQMIQFAAIFTIMGITAFQPNCDYPLWILFLVLPQNGFLLLLFWDFYKKAYIIKKDKAKSKQNSGLKNNGMTSVKESTKTD